MSKRTRRPEHPAVPAIIERLERREVLSNTIAFTGLQVPSGYTQGSTDIHSDGVRVTRFTDANNDNLYVTWEPVGSINLAFGVYVGNTGLMPPPEPDPTPTPSGDGNVPIVAPPTPIGPASPALDLNSTTDTVTGSTTVYDPDGNPIAADLVSRTTSVGTAFILALKDGDGNYYGFVLYGSPWGTP